MISHQTRSFGPPRRTLISPGWIRSPARFQILSFIEVYDGSVWASALIVDQEGDGFRAVLHATTGIRCEWQAGSGVPAGRPKWSFAQGCGIIGPADATLSLCKKRGTASIPSHHRALARIQSVRGAVFRFGVVWHMLCISFSERIFVYVQTPIITGQRLRRLRANCFAFNHAKTDKDKADEPRLFRK